MGELVTMDADATLGLIERVATTPGVDISVLERMLGMQERITDRNAESALIRALGEFQAACPPIKRTKKAGGGSISYKYAPLSDVVDTIKESLADHALSYRWEMQDDEGRMEVTCIISHANSGSKSTSMSAMPDDSGKKNAIQQRGSTMTYLQRYTLIGALGLSSADDDDDGRSAGRSNVETLIYHNAVAVEWLDHIIGIKNGLDDNGDITAAAELYAEMPRRVIGTLFIAPSKGGLFTTKERAKAKDDEVFKNDVHQRRKDAGWHDRDENQI